MRQRCACGKRAEIGKDECFLCRISSVGVVYKGSAQVGRGGWHKTKNDHMLEHFGTTSEKELAARGVERKT